LRYLFEKGERGKLAAPGEVPPSSPATKTQTETASKKKADVAEHTKVFDHVGLLVNGPPGTAGLPFI
jgi:hypothetical protein